MSRPIGGGASLAVTTLQGTSPQLLLTLSYAATGTAFVSTFATKSMTVGSAFYDGAILEVGKIQSQVKRNGSAVSSTCQLTLSDSTGALKQAFDGTVFERCAATLHLYYEGLSLADAIPLIVGNVVGPVDWDEENRTISFGIECRIEEQDCGFAPTTDDFTDLDPDANGIPWPMIFGSVAHSPCLKVHKKTTGTLLQPIQLYKYPPYLDDVGHYRQMVLDSPDVYTLSDDAGVLANTGNKNVLFIDNLPLFPASSSGSPITIAVNDVLFKGYADPADTNGQKFIVTQANAPKYTNLAFGARDASDPEHNDNNVAWLAADGISIANCVVYLQTAAGKVWVNYCETQHGRKCYFRHSFISPVTKQLFLITASNTMTEVYPISKCGMTDDIESMMFYAILAFQNPAGSNPAIRAYGMLKRHIREMGVKGETWWRADADTVVTPQIVDADVYIASLVKLQEIKAVYGKRRIKTTHGKTKTIFTPIPASYYTVQLSSTYTFAGQHASELIFNTPLTSYAGQDWEDTVYVSAKSTVGPNPVDIIKFIVENFTELDVDTVSFEAVRPKLRDANFTLFDKRDALKIIEEIAYQSRCGIIVDSGAVEIRFLPKQPFSAVVTLSDSNIDLKGLSCTVTPLSEITTKFVSTWTPDYREKRATNRFNERKTHQIEEIVRSIVPDARRTETSTQCYIYRNNEDVFGCKHPESQQFYIFNQLKYVKEATDFWGFRGSNCWKRATFKCFPDALYLQCFDLVSVAVSDGTVLGAALSGIVSKTTFDFKDMSVVVDVEFPVAAGSFAVDSSHYWPDNTF